MFSSHTFLLIFFQKDVFLQILPWVVGGPLSYNSVKPNPYPFFLLVYWAMDQTYETYFMLKSLEGSGPYPLGPSCTTF